MAYEPRFYREYHNNKNQLKVNITVKETDLLIIMDPVDSEKKIVSLITEMVTFIRSVILNYSTIIPEFMSSLEPIGYIKEDVVKVLSSFNQHDDLGMTLIMNMYEGATQADVGPMATVAGITSQLVVEKLMSHYGDINIIVENGGDIYMNASEGSRKISIYAGESTLSNRLALNFEAYETPVAICTSSGKIGHSLSFGSADALVVVARNAAVADGLATGLCNQICNHEDLDKVLSFAGEVKGIIGVLGIVEEHIGIWGQVNLVKS